MFHFIGLLTPNGILIEANQAALEFSGLTSEAVINRPFWDNLWWRTSPTVQAQIRRAIAQAGAGQLASYEAEVVGAENTVATVEFSLKPVKDAASRVVLLIAEGRDIEDRHLDDAELRRSEANNRAMLATLPDLLLRVQRDGSCLDFIPSIALEAWTFLTIEQHLSQILPPDLLQHQLRRIEEVLATGKLQVWEQQRLKEGKLCFEEIRMIPCGDDEVLAVVRDISERKQAQKQVELQAVITRNMAEGVCLVRAEDIIIVYANPKYERMFGYAPGELTNQPVSIVSYIDEHTSVEAVNQALRETIGRHGEESHEAHNVKKDGTPFWCQATTSLFEHPEHGTVMVEMQQDITVRKQAEAAVQASLLEKEVLLQEIHHRVKNNLAVVDGLLQMQSRRSHNTEVIEVLRESQNRIASIALVHEKLYSSDNLAQIDFAPYIVDLTAHLFDSYNIRADQITLTTQIDAIALDISVAVPCGLIINELVSNALKYAFPNQQAGEIQVTFRQQPDQTLTLTVRDNGSGLPANFNLKQTETLGISLIQGLVRQLQGTLEIDSDPGTTVTITFVRDNISESTPHSPV